MEKFFVIEGCDGCGKSTVIKHLIAMLEEKEIDFIVTHEPGGVKSAEDIRAVALSSEYDVDPLTELFLYLASRKEHLVKKVLPALNEGKLVLCDRFVASTIAYQGIGRNLGVDFVKTMNHIVVGNEIKPKTYFLDVTPEECLRRIANSRKQKEDRIDKEPLEFHKKIYEQYLKMAENGEMIKISADNSIDMAKIIFADIEKELQ